MSCERACIQLRLLALHRWQLTLAASENERGRSANPLRAFRRAVCPCQWCASRSTHSPVLSLSLEPKSPCDHTLDLINSSGTANRAMNPLRSIQHNITTPPISGGQPLDAVGPQAQQSHPKRISPSQLSQSAHQALERLSANAEHQRLASLVRNALQDGTFQFQSSNHTQVTYKASICLPADTDTVRTDHLINNELTVQARLNDQSEYDIVSAHLHGSSKAISFDVPSPPPAHGSASSVLSERTHLGMSSVLSQDAVDSSSLETPLVSSPDHSRPPSQPKPVHIGSVRRDSGSLVSDNPVVQALLSFVQADQAFPPQAASIAGVQLEMRSRRDIEQALEELKGAFTVEKAQLMSGGSSSERVDEDVNADIHIPLLLKAIERGAGAFGPGALIEIADGGQISAKAFLASCAPTITSNDDVLSEFINQKLKGDDDLQVRLGAQELLHVATKKEFQLGGLAGSIGVSSILGSAWELGASELLKNAIFGKNFSPSQYALQLAGIDSVPPFIIEAMDSFCVLVIIKGMKGELWSMKDLLPKALKAGAISSAMSFPNNVLQYAGFKSRVADLAANSITTEAAIFGAASGIPPEVKESEELMRAGLFQSMKDGVMAHPGEGMDTKETIERMTRHALDIAPGESTAVKSMGLAAIVGMIPLIASSKATGLVSEQILRIFRNAVFNPIEAIALNALALGGRVNVPGLFDSDNAKHARVAQTILARASQHMEAGDREISAEELHQMLAPRSEFLRHVGSAIVNGMNASFEAIPALVRKLGYGEAPLAERIPYQDLAVPDTSRQPAP
ncbi:Type III effector HopD1 [Pseudomonas savastanoi pv. glycinea]|nr:Type III effector HopD1 [Pseudomonas savastanoi pv. phaseolicola]RMM64821.1 Type III effector HopD1 [Pseudomonas savastanoi pv. glycinea]RMQ58029.1 Type III effector HopD1 [Pseudomonas savastanoi pv. glycinea]RMV63881.1 Type III effector HopD1 [Pseudomonas savastanoi pv. glycinea]